MSDSDAVDDSSIRKAQAASFTLGIDLGTRMSEFRSSQMEQHGHTVASIVAWDSDEFGILIEYGEGQWRKYRVGTRTEALKELQRLSLGNREECRIRN